MEIVVRLSEDAGLKVVCFFFYFCNLFYISCNIEGNNFWFWEGNEWTKNLNNLTAISVSENKIIFVVVFEVFCMVGV